MDRGLRSLILGIACLVVGIIFAFLNKRITIGTVFAVIAFITCLYDSIRFKRNN